MSIYRPGDVVYMKDTTFRGVVTGFRYRLGSYLLIQVDWDDKAIEEKEVPVGRLRKNPKGAAAKDIRKKAKEVHSRIMRFRVTNGQRENENHGDQAQPEVQAGGNSGSQCDRKGDPPKT